MRPYLGTFVEIGAQVNITDALLGIEQAISSAFSEIQLIHQLLSFHVPDSDLTRLNQAAGKAVKVHVQSLRVLRLARGMTLASDGLFNCTIGGMMVAQGVLPDHGGSDVLASGTADDIEISNGSARLKRNVKLTLDGIAKGYAVDCAISSMKHHGIASGWVNAGGDLRVFGNMTLPVQRREADGSFSAMGGLRNAALASSCVSVKYDERFPGKIVNPNQNLSNQTLPTQGVWSVISHWTWRADALTKVASLANDTDRAAIITKLGGVLAYPQAQVSRDTKGNFNE